MEYNLTGKTSLDDFIQFNKFHKKHSFLGKFSIVIYLALFLYLGFNIFPNIDTLIFALKSSPFEAFKIFLPLVIILAFIILMNIFLMPILYKKHYKSNKLMQQIQNIKINEQFISIVTETSNFKIIKSDINKIKYDKDTIYIYTALNIGHIIKKRFLENDNDFKEMVDFIKLNYDKK
jgi:hypothetical protein